MPNFKYIQTRIMELPMNRYLILATYLTTMILAACDAAPAQNSVDVMSKPSVSVSDILTDGFSERVDKIFEPFDSPDVPGCAVGIVHNGNFVHAKGYGAANLEHGIQIDRKTVFRIASVSKQFTALSIAILAQRGDLNLDADVHTYIPELQDYGTPVTIRQMVHHLSGMGDYNDSFEVAAEKPFRFGNEDYWTIDEFFNEVTKQPLAFKPGETYEYSNLAYFLLSQVVERVSGQSLREFSKVEIFDPLGMEDTFYNDNVAAIIPRRADGYEPLEDGGYETLMTNLNWVGDGGVYTSLDDFIKWDQALATGNVPGGVDVFQMIIKPHPATVRPRTNGDEGEIGYAFGMNVGTKNSRARRSHSGGWVGYRSFYIAFPDDDASLFTFCNRTDGNGKHTNTAIDTVISEYGD